MENINWSLAAPLIVLQLILVIAAFISLVKQENTNGPKWVWALIILFITTIGPILYFVIGRKSD
ncbi:PLD nuclease N-terminal domain-containing protein [Sutcliffiella horikoshii]|uniref:PLD nuclease N-terminal domain-containing protein n=1 Tax=Sutcliffiella horikoshii TaxID=79883 RepID=UPI0007D07BA5|nr:PLD nuclease N-terminal domain-containing protein [Sutcliffiella horikoshii]MCM3620223.1 PLD nuclease N-terminal domain-containing protein [Sutcliffiella horikoshii]